MDLNFADTPEIRAQIEAIPGVLAVAPRLLFSGILSLPEDPADPDSGGTTFFSAIGLDPGRERLVSPKVLEWISKGQGISSASAREVVLNEETAHSLKLVVHSATSAPPEEQWPAILAPDKDGSLNGGLVLPVGQLVSATPGDKRLALTSLGATQEILRSPGLVTEYGVQVHNLAEVPRIQVDIQALLGEKFEVHRWDEIQPLIKDLEKNIEYFFGIITGIFLLVVFLGIVNSMYMSVLERTREIGTMVALGVTRRQILGLFLMEGAALGLAGGLLATLSGSLVVGILNHVGIRISAPGSTLLMTVRPEVHAPFLVICLVACFLGSGVVSILPAVRAARLKPVEALAST